MTHRTRPRFIALAAATVAAVMSAAAAAPAMAVDTWKPATGKTRTALVNAAKRYGANGITETQTNRFNAKYAVICARSFSKHPQGPSEDFLPLQKVGGHWKYFPGAYKTSGALQTFAGLCYGYVD